MNNLVAPSGTRTGLAPRAIGPRDVLFQSVTAMGPAGALAVSVVVGATYAGGALPLAVIFAFIPCLTVAISIGQLAKHLPSAGSIYTYPARAIHPGVGFLVGWGYGLAAATWGAAVALMTSVQIAGVMTAGEGRVYRVAWTATFVAVTAVVLLLGYFGLRVSAKIGTILGSIEICIFVVLAAWLIGAAGQMNTWSPFGLKLATVKGYEGIIGVFAAAVYTVQAFVGFEAAAPLAEEARDPQNTITRATLSACAVIGVFYVVTTYAATIMFGARHFQDFANSPEHGSPWYALARSVWGAGWVAVFLAVLNSNFAGQIAFSNAATRTCYAMARIRLLPRALSRTHPRWRSPHIAVWMQFAYTLALGVVFGEFFGPVNSFILLATLCTAIQVGVYMLINISCVVYYARDRSPEFCWLIHGVLPVLGVVLLTPVLLTALGLGVSVLRFVAPLPYPISLCGPILGGWFLLGILYLVYLLTRHPERLKETSRIFLDES
ncbi:MAG: amino acid permease [Candidatus Acidiferrum sp.]